MLSAGGTKMTKTQLPSPRNSVYWQKQKQGVQCHKLYENEYKIHHLRTFNSHFTFPLAICISIMKTDFQGCFETLYLLKPDER